MRKTQLDKLFGSLEQGVLTLEMRLKGARLVGDAVAVLTYLEAVVLTYESMAEAANAAGDHQREVDYRTRKLLIEQSDPDSVSAELEEIRELPLTPVQWALLNELELRMAGYAKANRQRGARRRKPPEL
ncbi:MAG: hypothetical protein ACK4P3_07200 [Fimbriimonadaceae bacterium]